MGFRTSQHYKSIDFFSDCMFNVHSNDFKSVVVSSHQSIMRSVFNKVAWRVMNKQTIYNSEGGKKISMIGGH